MAFLSFQTVAFALWVPVRRKVATRVRCASSKSYDALLNKNLVGMEECIQAQDGIVFVDGSWYHKGDRNGRKEFETGPRIANARHMDMSDIATTKELFPDLNPKGIKNMLPTKELFASAMDAFGISNDDHVVVYGKEGSVFTPRTWFLFRALGHDAAKVHLLQGSFEEWVQNGGATEDGPTTVPTAKEILDQHVESPPSYVASDLRHVVGMDDVMASLDKDVILVDPRGSSFAGGHIPGSVNIPYSSLVEPDNELKLKSKGALNEIFQGAGLDPLTKKTIISTCGSGVSACHIILALEECGRDLPTLLYDGSWSEWGSDPNTPKSTLQ